ncbi:sensor histidine kinase [Catenulispora rubra]|uniref:sensor histidine kinase n=1 Tax=Catenulispora rubra TaxID=280293 RepID=UPI00189207FE|nr:HAMP domain-containing sensor histidine kinase [Catenulispora rubra]
MVAVTACGVLLFTLPLAWALAEVYRSGAVVMLQRDAVWVAAEVGARPTSGAGALAGLDELSHDVDVGLYAPDGHRIAGEGPAASRVAAMVRRGGFHQGVEAGHLAVAAPVTRGGRVEAAVRVWMPWKVVTDRWQRACVLLAGLGSVVVALSALLAWHLARRVAIPLERLTTVARALGDGDFTIQAPRTGIREADVAGQALAATARRLGDVLERERRFTTAVSHQLRTPLTALVLGLESAQTVGEDDVRREAVATALRRAEHLAETVEELLRLARETHGGDIAVDAAHVAERVAERYRVAAAEAGRPLVVRCEQGLEPVRVAEAAIAQIMGALLDNALVHGRGEIRVSVVDVGTGVAVEVGDDGPGLCGGDDAPDLHFSADEGSPASTNSSLADTPAANFPAAKTPAAKTPAANSLASRRGIGLPLARSLAEAEGGRLVVRHAGPRPVFSLLLPLQRATPDMTSAASSASLPATGNS